MCFCVIRDGTADKGMVSLWGFYAQSPSPRATEIMERLVDLGERRIADMDATGIDVAILALTSPGAADPDVEGSQGLWRGGQ
jgi:2,3-dihydroxybenzoate decarboxylase